MHVYVANFFLIWCLHVMCTLYTIPDGQHHNCGAVGKFASVCVRVNVHHPKKRNQYKIFINELLASYILTYLVFKANSVPSSKQLRIKSFVLPIKINVRTASATCCLHSVPLLTWNALIYMHVNRISLENHMHFYLFIYRRWTANDVFLSAY